MSKQKENILKELRSNVSYKTDIQNLMLKMKKGIGTMCEVIENYVHKAVTKANIDSIKFMITTLNASKEQILQQYSECEYNEALNELSKK